MREESKCLLFKKLKSLIGKSIGHCDVDTTSTNCEGDVKFCEKPESLRQYFQRVIESAGKENR
jgi:hypothetical protein